MGSPVPASEHAPLRRGVLPNLRYDLPAGMVVFLVALPLCLGIAMASDAPLLSGLVAGVVAGLVVAPLSGSQLSVSGPAAGLTVIVAGGAVTLGGFEHLLAATIVAGAIQLVAGAARLGFLANFIPVAVIEGMLAGIGIILVLKQIPHALGRDLDFEGDESFWMLGHQSNTFQEIASAVMAPHPGVMIVSAAALALLLLWNRPFIARTVWSRLLPGPLVAVGAGVLINEGLRLFFPALSISAESGHLVALPVPESPAALLTALPRPSFAKVWTADLWIVGATIAAVASVETLLSIEAVDKIDPFRRTSGPSRELIAQGVGNVAAGLVGGLPITSVIVRSSANVYSGARTRVAAIVHSALLLSLVVAVPFLLNRIPLGALAAVLIVIGYRLARVGLFLHVYRQGAQQFIPFSLTILVTVFSDLLLGVAVGMVAGIVLVLVAHYASAIAVERDGDDWLILFTKDVNFLNKTRLRCVLAQIPDGAAVVIDGSRAQFVDHDIRAMIGDFVVAARHRGIDITTRGLRPPLHLPGAT